MQDLIIASSGFVAGIITALALFKYGMNYATTLIYKIKEDIPLEQIGKPYATEFNETE